jgi:hypothetical protein
LLLAAWVPHYLTWPFSRDEDTFAVLAMSWDRGILPYRDIRGYNFPGETYLFWVLGKVFGWGGTVPFYAVDAVCVIVLGGVLVIWSRKRLRGALPGLIAYLAFLSFYMNLGYGLTGQRDWHTALLATVGIMIMQAVPGPRPRAAAALTTAIALAIRPHAVLFVPALVAAAVEQGDSSRSGWPASVRNAIKWILMLGIFSAILFAPLFLAGIADDLAKGLRVASYGGPYSKVTPAAALGLFVHQFTSSRLDLPLAATLVLAAWPRLGLTRMARTWCLAWLGALVYRPLHPVHHVYLIHPVVLVASITSALPVSLLLSARRLPRPVIIFGVMILAYEASPARPFNCNLPDSAHALRTLALGQWPAEAPLGCHNTFAKPSVRDPNANKWAEYCAVLDYVRRTTGPRTLVANVLNSYPYESINGPTGRLSPFLAESGICWMTLVNVDVDPEFADALERAEDSVVVWLPHKIAGERRMRYEKVHAVIRKYYEPAARFGKIEVWRRKPVITGQSSGS